MPPECLPHVPPSISPPLAARVLCLGLGVQSTTSRELKVVETASELLDTALPDTPDDEEVGMPSLLHGFEESPSQHESWPLKQAAPIPIPVNSPPEVPLLSRAVHRPPKPPFPAT